MWKTYETVDRWMDLFVWESTMAMKVSIAWLLVLVVVSMIVLPHSFVDAKSKDKKAKSAIIKAIGKAVEGKYSTIKLIQLSKSNVTGYVLAYNNTKAVPPPVVLPNPPPNPPPTPSGNISKVCLVGDLSGSTVPNLMKANGCDLKIGLGDLGYQSDLSYFKGLKFDKCVVGNHDATEDGSSAIYKEALAYCGDHWSLKIVNGTTLILGFNTNGDITTQVQSAKTAISQNPQVQNIILVSHKGGHVPPNSHHPAEASTLYKQLEPLIPSSIKLYEIFGHNHVSSAAPSKNWYQAGAGGKSFYSCGTDDVVWTYCDNKSLQYLELTISNSDGATAAKFIK
jgi:predicted phosphodiesterase